MSKATDQIDRLIASGEELARAQKHGEALSQFTAAWNALSDPKDEQDAAIGILASIADCCFFLARWEDCCNAVQHAFHCGADVSNPFLRLRLGQCMYELGNVRESANWLVPVYLMESRAAFKGEDPKYLASFQGKLKAPDGGWPDGW